MSVIGRDAPPPQEAWDTLREWSQRSTGERFRLSLRMMLPIVSAVVGVGGVALLFVEPSWRSVALITLLWLVAMPLAAFGHMRRIDHSAALVPPISPASLDPTTAVDIRRAPPRPPPV